MFTGAQNNFYFGDMAVGDRPATDEEVAAWIAARTPDPKDAIRAQIREREALIADDQARMNRIVSLEVTLDRACADPLAAGLTRQQVHEALMVMNNGYSRMYNEEQTIAALRAQL